jgi:hypothetical protein
MQGMVPRTDFDRSTFQTQPFVLRVEKPWGFELIFTPPEQPYCGKLLYVTAGRRLSLQIHDQKRETVMLLYGRGVLLCDEAGGELVEIFMEPLKGYTILPGQRHRLIALETCAFVESSTPETGTTYRLDDDTGRPDETEERRLQERSPEAISESGGRGGAR